MRPTREQIEVAAYHRWERRQNGHGADGDDWTSAEKDLTFGLNYRYATRLRLDGPAVLVGKDEVETTKGQPRRCRFCEQAEPAVVFARNAPAILPDVFGHSALRAWDECDSCRARYEDELVPAFESFVQPLLQNDGEIPDGIPLQALQALIRTALSIMPKAELHHFGDTIEWLANPEHERDVSLLSDLACQVYLTPTSVPTPTATLARRVDDDAPWPYILFFLATSRVVFATHIPLCPRDEDLEDDGVRCPELSMSLGTGADLRSSVCLNLPVIRPAFARHDVLSGAAYR